MRGSVIWGFRANKRQPQQYNDHNKDHNKALIYDSCVVPYGAWIAPGGQLPPRAVMPRHQLQAFSIINRAFMSAGNGCAWAEARVELLLLLLLSSEYKLSDPSNFNRWNPMSERRSRQGANRKAVRTTRTQPLIPKEWYRNQY